MQGVLGLYRYLPRLIGATMLVASILIVLYFPHLLIYPYYVFIVSFVLIGLFVALKHSDVILINPSFYVDGASPVPNLSEGRAIGYLFAGQLVFYFGIFIFFGWLAFHSQRTAFIPDIDFLVFIKPLLDDMVVLGFLPWVLITIQGVALAYFVFKQNKPPSTGEIIVESLGHRRFFWKNVINGTISTGVFYLPMLLMCLVAYLFTDSVLVMLAGKYELRTPASYCLILLIFLWAFYIPLKNLAGYFVRKKYSFGAILMVYTGLIIAALLLGIQGITILEKLIVTQPPEEPLASQFITQLNSYTLSERYRWLIVGWWLAWLPFLTAWIARLSYGLSIGEAIVRPIIFPALFMILLRALPELDWLLIWQHGFLQPWVALSMSLLLAMFSYYLYQNVRSMNQLRCGPLPLGQFKGRSIVNMVRLLFIVFPLFLGAIYLWGWFFVFIAIGSPAIMQLCFAGWFMTKFYRALEAIR